MAKISLTFPQTSISPTTMKLDNILGYEILRSEDEITAESEMTVLTCLRDDGARFQLFIDPHAPEGSAAYWSLHYLTKAAGLLELAQAREFDTELFIGARCFGIWNSLRTTDYSVVLLPNGQEVPATVDDMLHEGYIKRLKCEKPLLSARTIEDLVEEVNKKNRKNNLWK